MNPPHPTNNNHAVTCPACHTEIGRLVTVADQGEWLQVGDVLVRSLHGVCMTCGAQYHWTLADRALAELVSRVMELRNEKA